MDIYEIAAAVERLTQETLQNSRMYCDRSYGYERRFYQKNA